MIADNSYSKDLSNLFQILNLKILDEIRLKFLNLR
jgi:hypothetical protein